MDNGKRSTSELWNLCEDEPPAPKRKIPPPSETRWLLYRDTLRAVFEQTDAIEKYMNLRGNREKWAHHISTPKHPLGQIKDVPFSFKHPLVRAHFHFAKDILDILGDLNEMFQAKYAFINNMWECLVSLFHFLSRELEKIEHNDFGRFPYLREIGVEHRAQFVVIMKHLILNLKVRFFNVSSSLDRRIVKPFLDYNNTIVRQGAPGGDGSRCGILPLLQLFDLKPTQVPDQLYRKLIELGVVHEWDGLLNVVMDETWRIEELREQRNHQMSTREKELRKLLETPTTKNLCDVFGAVSKTYFPATWKFVVRMLTIMPTTVACEQSFSFFERTFHTNMGETRSKLVCQAESIQKYWNSTSCEWHETEGFRTGR